MKPVLMASLALVAFVVTTRPSIAQNTAPLSCASEAGAIADTPRRAGRAPTPAEMLAAANDAARQRPETTSFVGARQIYTFAPGAIYELFANPNYISAILLEPGERLTDVAAGDTARWMVQEVEAEAEGDGRMIVLVKPQASGLRTNIVLITDRRTYTIEAMAHAGSIYSAQIAWCYPERTEPTLRTTSVEALNFAYRIRTVRGRTPSWRPIRIFDDGQRTWIELPEASSSEMPPLFVVTDEGAELANYRVQGHRYMVDRVFDVAELRLGTRAPIVVRIERVLAPEPRARRGGGRQ